MSIAITVAGASFIHNIGRAYPPYFANLKGFFTLGGTAGESAVNRAPGGGTAATPVGTVVYQPGYVEVGKADGFNTGLLVPPEHTQVVVFRPAATSSLFGMCGAWLTGTYTDSLFLSGATGGNAVHQAAYNASVRATANETGLRTGFMMGAMTRNASGGLLVISNANGEVLDTPYTYSGATPQNAWLIGASNFGTSTSTAGIAAAALYDRALSASELADVYTGMKEMLAGRVDLA